MSEFRSILGNEIPIEELHTELAREFVDCSKRYGDGVVELSKAYRNSKGLESIVCTIETGRPQRPVYKILRTLLLGLHRRTWNPTKIKAYSASSVVQTTAF